MIGLHVLFDGLRFHASDESDGTLESLICIVKIKTNDDQAYWMPISELETSDELVLGHVIIQIGLLRRELGIVSTESSDLDEQPSVRVPVEDALPDVELNFSPLDEDEHIEFALVLALVRDSDGEEVGWSYRTSEAPNMEELLGALEVVRAELTRDIALAWNGKELSP